MPRRVSLPLIVLALALLVPASASAGGFEFTSQGTRALGRGGAFAARADDPMALVFNPAMLADLGESQIMLNAHLAFMDACVQRTGPDGQPITYLDAIPTLSPFPSRFDEESPTWLNDTMPRVCNGGPPQAIPWLIGSVRLLPELSLAFGIVAPAGVGSTRWGDNGVVQTSMGARPSPVRYAVAEQDVLLFHPSVGLGWRIADWIRVGFTFQWGIGIVNYTNFTSAGSGSEDPFDDIRTHLEVQDWFVPASILSVHLQPHPNFDVMLSGRISDAIGGATEAGGHLDLTTRYFATGSMAATTRIENVRLQAGQPWQFQLGLRYADRIRPRSWERGFEAAVRGVVDDPMYSENFDIELDVVYELNSQVRDFVVSMPSGSAVIIDGIRVPVPTPQPIPHGWSDVITMRLGGDWNIIPGQVAARAGFHTEIPLAQSRYQINDFVSGYRFGLHLGATFRIERFDISVAYAHIFQLDTTITDGNFRGVAASGSAGGCDEDLDSRPDAYDPDRAVSTRGCYPPGYGQVVNNGTYTTEYNVLSVGASYHFE